MHVDVDVEAAAGDDDHDDDQHHHHYRHHDHDDAVRLCCIYIYTDIFMRLYSYPTTDGRMDGQTGRQERNTARQKETER